MAGFLLEDDAVSARKNVFDDWLEEQKRNAAAAAQQLQSTTQAATQAAADEVAQRRQQFDQWLASQQPQQAPPQPAQPTPAPAPMPTPAPTLMPTASAPVTPEAQQRANAFDEWVNQRKQDVANVTSQLAAPALPHTEEPATRGDTLGSAPGAAAADDLASRWKTQFDFGATYTGDYRTGTPHRGVDLVPSNGKGIGTEVDAFTPGKVTLIQRDSGAGGLMVYVQDDQGLTHAYMHLAGTQPGLKVGDLVQRGQPIAMMGESGTEGSPHLHYEVRKNAATGDPLNQLIDPRPYLSGGTGQAQPTRVQPAQPAQDLLANASDRVRGQVDAIRQASQSTGVPQSIIAAIMDTEAGGPKSESPQGALGFMQVLRSWFKAGEDPFDPVTNITRGAEILADNYKRWGAWDKAAAAYFGAIDSAGNILGGAKDALGTSGSSYVSKFQNNLQNYAQGGAQAVEGLQRAGSNALDTLGQDSRAVADRAQQLADQSTQLAQESARRAQEAQDLLTQTRQRATAENDRYFQQQDLRRQQQSQDLLQPRQFDLSMAQNQAAQPLRPADSGFAGMPGVSSPGDILGGFVAPGGPVGQYFDKLGSAGQSLAQHALQNPLTPLITPGEAGQELQRQFTTGVPAKIMANDREITDAAANAALSKARDFGANPTPEQEQAIRTAFSAFAPSTLPLMFTGGAGGIIPRIGEGIGLTALSGAGMAAGEALEPNLPEPLRPLAPLIGGFAAPVAGSFAAGAARAGVRGALRNPDVTGFLRDESTLPRRVYPRDVPGEPGVINARYGAVRTEPIGDEGVAARPAPPTAAQPALGAGRVREEPGPQQMAIRRVGEPGPSAMATQGPSMGGGTVGITQSPTFLRESLRRMYPGAINKAAAKEAVQNSVDASRDNPGATTRVNVDNTDKTISIVDEGKGMSPQTMEDVFVKLGGSSKPAGASGGMGTAIKAIMANAEDTWVRTIGRDPETGELTDSVMHGSGDDFLGGTMHRYYAKAGELPYEELNGAPAIIQDLDQTAALRGTGTGTAIWTKPMSDVEWSPYSLNAWVQHFNATSRIPNQNVEFTIDGQTIQPGFRVGMDGSPRAIPEEDKASQLIHTLHLPGADIDFYASPGTQETSYGDIKLLNNGQYQADQFVQLPGNAKMPRTLVADVRATIDPKSVGYPWTADRNSLIDTVQNAVKGYVANGLARTIIGNENQRVADTINNAPMIGSVKLVDDAGLAETSAADRWAQIPKHPGYRRLANLINDLHEGVISEVQGKTVFGQEIGQSHLVGLAASEKWLGLNVPSSYTPWANSEEARGILINPWAIWHEVEQAFPGATRDEQISRYADMMLGTMLHEVSHNTSIGGHGEEFAGVLTRLPGFLGSSMQAAITKQLRSGLARTWDTLGRDLEDDTSTFRYAARPSDLERYGLAARGRRSIERAGTPPDNLPRDDQGGAGTGPRPGSEPVLEAGATNEAQPQAELAASEGAVAQAAKALVVRSGGVRAALATQGLADAIERIKPTLTPDQVSAAAADFAKLPRGGASLPPGVSTSEDLAALRVHLNELVDDGAAGRDWYINSAKKILDAVGGDKVQAEKLAQLVGMMARNVNPEQNVNYAIEAWNQWKSGTPVANVHRFTDVSKSAADLLERGIPWEGRKTNSFYVNLMEEIDKNYLAQRKVTADIWVNRAFGYHGKAPAGGQYNFIEDELRRIADERNLRPSQVQAMLWVGQMARQAPNADGAADFSHALQRRMAQIGWETAPGTGEIPGYANATPEAQSAYNHDVGQAFLDDNGKDIVTQRFGGLGGHSFEAPGVWSGDVTPGWQTQVGVASTAMSTPGGATLRPASKQTIEAIAAAKGYLLSTLPDNKQNAVGWTQVFPSSTVQGANAVDVNAGRLLTTEEAQQISAGLTQAMSSANPLPGEDVPFIMTSTERGAWLRNTSDMPNTQFHKAVEGALSGVESDASFDATPVRADSGLVYNDWSKQPNGEGYLEVIRRGGREGAFRPIQDSLGQRVAQAQREAAARHFSATPSESAPAAAGAPAPVERGLPGAAGAEPAAGVGPPPPPDGEGFTAPTAGSEPPPSGGARGAVRDFLTGQGSEEGSANVGAMLKAGQFGAGVLGSEATMSDQDKQDPWGRVSRDLGFGTAALAGPGVAAAIARRGGPLNWQDLRQMHTSQQPLLNAPAGKQTVAQFLSAMGKNNLLSGPGTQISNIFSQLIELGLEPARRAAAGYSDEAVAGVKAAGQAIPDGLRNAVGTFRQGRAQFDPSNQYTPAKWFALRALGAADDFFRTIGYAMGSGMEAQRFIRENPGMSPQRVLQANQAAIDAAGQRAARLSVFAEGSGPGHAISELKNRLMSSARAQDQVAGMALDAAVPFSNVPGRIWTAGLRRLPGVAEAEALGRAGIAAKAGDERGARLAMGGGLVASIINTSIISNVMNGNITGPEDKEHPTSIKINGQWVDYSRWGPYMLPIALPAAWIEAARKEGNKPDPDQMKAFYNATFKTMANQFYAADMIKVLSQVGEGNAAGATGQLAGSYIDRYLPAGGALNFANQAWDPIMRDTTNKGFGQFLEREQAKIPVLAQMLPAQPSMTSGEPEQRLRSGLPGTLLGVQTRRISDFDAEVNRLEKLGYSLPNPTKPPTEVTVQGARIALNESEQRELTYQRGVAIDKVLTPLVTSATFQRMTDDQKARAIASRLSNVDNDTARNWERMTPAAERTGRIREGRTVAGRREPVTVGGR